MSSPASGSASPLPSSSTSNPASFGVPLIPCTSNEGPRSNTATTPIPYASASASASASSSFTSRNSLRRVRTTPAVLGDSQGVSPSVTSGHTLLEFLQNEGPENADSRQGQEAGDARNISATNLERKRRLTSTSDSTGQSYPNGPAPSVDSGSSRPRPGPSVTPSWRRSSLGIPGSSSGNAIDLSASPESVTRQLNSLRHRENSFTDYDLPRWQSDSEVSKCPICNTAFSFWYRKHHCRKCGRVVCASCSPHRITIPRQFIVRPPESGRQLSTLLQPNPSQIQIISLLDNVEEDTSATSGAHLSSRGQQIQQRDRYRPNSALGGGEEVRLCNPCVPDPNPEPPRRYTSTSGSLLSGSGRLSSSLSTWTDDHAGVSHAPTNRHSAFPVYYRHGVGHRRDTNHFHRPSASLSAAATMPRSQEARDLRRQRGRGMIFQPETPEIQRAAAQEALTDEGLPSYGSFDYTVVPNFRGIPPRYQSTQQVAGGQHPRYSPPAYSLPSSTSPSNSRHHSIHTFPHYIPSHRRGPSSPSSRNRPVPPASITTTTRHRPPIDERDICPVCSHILPPRAADGSEEAREAHVRACIEGHGRPIIDITSPGSSGHSTSQQISSNHGSSNSNDHGDHHADRPLRMLPFTATEKDCVGEDSGPQECTICMEEYEVGDPLVRLECLCKFHKRCIVGWFEKKMECPVHKVN
ncbi:uncharacterized protein PADG_04362 [Paracoccidioides brasiliensis Pb18]|uniref:RING-type E3 ubiquitin transferase n=1 Tax=Paracoccidioides brasiliensis (strain Pb18) TaxID=502780 RepID=C1GAS6_PARBD|nr:uncharacterized protein PADG_04362 [Paracoccidioides brasiliensis Pb18]EEH48278.2 hypothetical protein PADG_04362 [Paracoccidioides brasiliensis Pb18]